MLCRVAGQPTASRTVPRAACGALPQAAQRHPRGAQWTLGSRDAYSAFLSRGLGSPLSLRPRMTSVEEVVVLAAASRPGTFALCSSLMHEVSASSPGGRPACPVSPEQESSRMRSLFLAAVIVAAPGAALAQDAAAGEKTFAQCRA